MATHAYMDESDRRDYLMCASIIDSAEIKAVHGQLRGLLLPGMPRIHMKNESDRLKKAVLSALKRMDGVTNVIYVASHRVRREGRAEILRRVVDDQEVRRLVLESRGTQDHEDRQVLRDAVWKAGKERELSYSHMRPESEPLLWIPDALAWAYGKGGDWRRRASRAVANVVMLSEP